MRRLVLTFTALAIALCAPLAHAKGEHDKSARLTFTTHPQGTPPGQPWQASFSIVRGSPPAGVSGLSPVVVISDEAAGITRQFAARPGPTAGDYVATVSFPAAGNYEVSVERFDPRDPQRFIDMGPPVRITPVATTGGGGGGGIGWSTWLLVAAAAALVLALCLWALRSVRAARAPLHTRGG